MTTATAAREQFKQGKTCDDAPRRTATLRRTDGITNDRPVGGDTGKYVSGVASGGGRWGAYDGAGSRKPLQEEGEYFEAFDLEYYDGLSRQDEVCEKLDSQTFNRTVVQASIPPSNGLYDCTAVPPVYVSTMIYWRFSVDVYDACRLHRMHFHGQVAMPAALVGFQFPGRCPQSVMQFPRPGCAHRFAPGAAHRQNMCRQLARPT